MGRELRANVTRIVIIQGRLKGIVWKGLNSGNFDIHPFVSRTICFERKCARENYNLLILLRLGLIWIMFVGFSINIVGVWLFKFVVYRTFHILTLSYILYKRKNVGYINPEFDTWNRTRRYIFLRENLLSNVNFKFSKSFFNYENRFDLIVSD